LTRVLTGNAERDGGAYRGWFIGHFMQPGLASTDAVEVKWGTHTLHETRPRWATSKQATTLSMLIRGRIRLFFREQEALLAQPGDYALWGPGVAHRWQIEADDTVVLTVRWPSRSGDAHDV
jgi:quercetin dioxygenase-like cupin family protein